MQKDIRRNSDLAKFKSEEALVVSFLEFQRRTKPKSVEVVREFDGGLGLADVVFYCQNHAAQSDVKKLAEINPRLAVLLDSKICEGITSLEDLRLLLGTDLRVARTVANQLKRAGIAEELDTQRLRLQGLKKPPFTNIISIEAKLSDWRRGLNQAFRYTQFSDESWLLVDTQTRFGALKNIASFARTGVGLASFSTSGELFIHLAARNQLPTSLNKYWRAQALLART